MKVKTYMIRKFFMSKCLFAILILVTAFSCKKESEIKQDLPLTSTRDTIKDNNQPVIFEGLYTINRHESTFLDCSSSNSKYWLVDESKSLEEQFSKMFEIPSVYNSIVVKVKGEIESTDNSAIAEKYPKTLRVKEVISAEKKNFNNTCVPYEFWALGNEPNWSLEISKNENLIEFDLPGEGTSFYFFYNEPRTESENLVYRNHNQIQRYSIEIRIKKEPCSDTMSGKVYEYSVEVELSDKRTFKGCGIKGKG